MGTVMRHRLRFAIGLLPHPALALADPTALKWRCGASLHILHVVSEQQDGRDHEPLQE